MIAVLHAGARTTIQDAGRPGLAHLGIPCSGAADARSFGLSNRLVGNVPGAAALELTYAGPRLRFEIDACVALCGAQVEADAGGRPMAMNAPSYLRAGDVLRLGRIGGGARAYLAVRGGLDVAAILGSRARDTLTGLGPSELVTGEKLPIGDLHTAMPGVDVAPVEELDPRPVLKVALGPRDDWFDPAATRALLGEPFLVDPSSNRVGIRLRGTELIRRRHDELLSEGLVPGCLQVPPSGDPILLLNDHPTTGGYPVIAVVVTDDLPVAGQLRAGQAVRFRL